RPARGFRPRIEALEDRAVPASLIDVTFQNGKLSITGSSGDDNLFFHQEANGLIHLNTEIFGTMKVNGVQVNGLLGTTLNAPVTGDVTIDMGGGKDFIDFSGQNGAIDLPSSLHILGGDGDNEFWFQNGVTVGGDLTINNGVGKDTTKLYGDINVL